MALGEQEQWAYGKIEKSIADMVSTYEPEDCFFILDVVHGQVCKIDFSDEEVRLFALAKELESLDVIQDAFGKKIVFVADVGRPAMRVAIELTKQAILHSFNEMIQEHDDSDWCEDDELLEE